MQLTRNHLERYLIDALLRQPDQKSEPAAAPDAAIFSLPEDQLNLEEKIALHTLKPVAEEIKRTAEGYTNLRNNTIAPLSSDACRAYALYYTLINFEKIERLLKIALPSLPSRPLRVLDYGCGPGTATFALATAASAPFSLTAADNNPAMRTLASSLLKPLVKTGMLSSLTVAKPEEVEQKSTFDLILAAHVFNEFPAAQQRMLADKLLSGLSADGTLLIIESALQEQTRQLMSLRDYILAQDTALQVVFPCTHRNPCPMYHQHATEWCHGSLAWNPPHLVRQLDQLTGFNKHRIKYSAFILSRNLNAKVVAENSYRVVAPPEKSKRGDQRRLCGQNFYGEVLMSKRVRSENNLEFRRAEHLDLLEIDPAETVSTGITADTRIERKRAP